MAPAREEFVETNGVRLHYLLRGDAPRPLVLLPGITSPAGMWDFVSQVLAETCTVYALDLRGRGSSDKPASGYRLEDYAQDVIGFLQELDLKGVILLGHSMGARIAAAVAAKAPERLRGLILADPPVSGPGRRPYPIPLQWYLDSLAAASQGLEALRAIYPDWSRERLLERVQWLRACRREAVVESYESFHNELMHVYLPRIPVETLLIYAERGDTVRPEEAEEIVSLLPNGHAVRIENAGHMIPWDNLPDFVRTVRAHCDRVTAQEPEHGSTFIGEGGL